MAIQQPMGHAFLHYFDLLTIGTTWGWNACLACQFKILFKGRVVECWAMIANTLYLIGILSKFNNWICILASILNIVNWNRMTGEKPWSTMLFNTISNIKIQLLRIVKFHEIWVSQWKEIALSTIVITSLLPFKDFRIPFTFNLWQLIFIEIDIVHHHVWPWHFSLVSQPPVLLLLRPLGSVTRKKLPNVYKSCLKLISL